MDPTYHIFSEGELVLDTRRFPVVIATVFGTIDIEGVRVYSDWLDTVCERARVEHTRVITIVDTLGLRWIANEPRQYGVSRTRIREQRMPQRRLATLAVVDSPIVRGMIASAVWMLRRRFRLQQFKTINEALLRAQVLLEGASIEPPAGLGVPPYESPARPRQAS